ncbi:MAG: hypothetical protein JWQ98_884 [Chlorobi bacterium]|nr:hypothetical protein [Chlorobiota bacterium]
MAYPQRSPRAPDKYFQTWHESIAPISDQGLSGAGEMERTIYAIDEQAFAPFEYSPGGPDSMMNYRYTVIQGSIRYGISDSIPTSGFDWPRNIPEGEVGHFRPRVSRMRMSGITVYLMPEREAELNEFPDHDDAPFAHREREEFLKPYMFVTHHHWMKGWHVVTPPAIGILLNRALNSATISLRVGYYFWMARLARRDGKWIVLTVKSAGVE